MSATVNATAELNCKLKLCLKMINSSNSIMTNALAASKINHSLEPLHKVLIELGLRHPADCDSEMSEDHKRMDSIEDLVAQRNALPTLSICSSMDEFQRVKTDAHYIDKEVQEHLTQFDCIYNFKSSSLIYDLINGYARNW